MPIIIAKMQQDWIRPYQEGTIPVVFVSDHPRFTPGTRLDWGFVQTAIGDGWAVTIEPHKTNRSNCNHPDGFDHSGLLLGRPGGKEYRLYYCPVCRATRGVLIEDEIIDHYPTDHPWAYTEEL